MVIFLQAMAGGDLAWMESATEARRGMGSAPGGRVAYRVVQEEADKAARRRRDAGDDGKDHERIPAAEPAHRVC